METAWMVEISPVQRTIKSREASKSGLVFHLLILLSQCYVGVLVPEVFHGQVDKLESGVHHHLICKHSRLLIVAIDFT